ncbi:hypothetical protein [Desulfosoma sp.]|uniref:hypothetical protein n=2 Tax=Desulfosoma sp. TaxID=2603217 RepID=UPI00404AD14B
MYFAKNDPTILLLGFGEEDLNLYRHPRLDKPYFQELLDVWPAWKDTLDQSAIYGAYFPAPGQDFGIGYWQALVNAAQGRPVFQECRTSGRIGAIKARLGGYHIYLWRNPWDQWWSYKVTPYFDIANQLIIHAHNAPEPVRLMMADLALPACPKSDIAEALAFYGLRPQDSERSYLIFYMLWCLGLKEATAHADVLLNIDKLSDSMDYRAEIQDRLTKAGIDGVDFSDCHIPQGRYLEQDQIFFAALEDRVHEWLKEGGWTQAEVDEVQLVRQRHQPASWSVPIHSISAAEMAKQAAWARELARRFETNRANAEARAAEAEARAVQAEASWERIRKELHHVHQANHYHWQLAEARRQQIEALLNSKSWRITQPLRALFALALYGRDTFQRQAERITASLLSGLIRFAVSSPRVKRLALAWIGRYPGLEASLTRFAVQRGLTGSQAAQGSAVSLSPEMPYNIANLPPRARQIYFQLKAAIEHNQKENG